MAQQQIGEQRTEWIAKWVENEACIRDFSDGGSLRTPFLLCCNDNNDSNKEE